MTLRSMSRTIILIAAGNIGLLCAPAPIFAQERECSVPERFYVSEPQLTKTPKAIVHGQELVIVVLGGASTLGSFSSGCGSTALSVTGDASAFMSATSKTRKPNVLTR